MLCAWRGGAAAGDAHITFVPNVQPGMGPSCMECGDPGADAWDAARWAGDVSCTMWRWAPVACLLSWIALCNKVHVLHLHGLDCL